MTLLCGDAVEQLRDNIADESVDCVVTGPPYYGLRDYGGLAGQIGGESHPREYIEALRRVFREVWRVLKPDGTVWVVINDTYTSKRGVQVPDSCHPAQISQTNNHVPEGLRNKSLMLNPARFGLAMLDDGWIVRDDMIWHKPNPKPEKVEDRPHRTHEYIWMLAKSEQYYYNGAPIRELAKPGNVSPWREHRTVISVLARPHQEGHPAEHPAELYEPFVLAGCRPNGLVLDPFCGSGTVGFVCRLHGRQFYGIDLNPRYVAMAHERITRDGASPPQVVVYG